LRQGPLDGWRDGCRAASIQPSAQGSGSAQLTLTLTPTLTLTLTLTPLSGEDPKTLKVGDMAWGAPPSSSVFLEEAVPERG